MGDDITIGVTEIVNNIEVNAQPNDQIVDISVTDNADNVTLNITPTVVEVNINKGSSFAQWGDLYGTLSDQTDLQNALNLKANLVGGKVPASELPSYVDDIIEVANYAALPATGETGKIYVTLDNNKIYRWSGSIYIEIASNSAIWGAITGTLSSQTDLVNALNLRVPYTGATSNVNLGEYGLTSGFLGLDTTPTSTPTGIGTIYWDAANRTAALIDGDGDTTLQIGQEQRILVHNNTGSTLTDGQVVYVTGSTGNVPSVSLANASSETTSAATIGVVTESIAQGADGFITTSGIVNGLNTLAFNEGDLLWLGTTAGTFTATKPISPNHLVLIGYVIKKAGGNGSILVKIQNTQELEESSDVLFTSLTNKDFLVYESATDLWKNKSLGTVLGGTSSQFVKGNGILDSTTYQPLLTNPVTGTGLQNFVTKWTGIGSAITESKIYDNGTNVGIGSINPSSLLELEKNNATGGGFLNIINTNSAMTGKIADINFKIGDSFGIPVDAAYIQAIPANANVSTGASLSFFTRKGNADPTASFTINNVGAVTINNLAGTGSRMVIANSTGQLSTQAITLGTVTSVSALTIGTTGTDITSTVANETTTPVITLNVPTASAANRGALSAADWTTFNSKQSALSGTGFVKITGSTISYDNSTYVPTSRTLTINGTAYDLSADRSWTISAGVTGTGTTNYIPKFTGTSAIGNSLIYDNGTNVGIGNASPSSRFFIKQNINSFNGGLRVEKSDNDTSLFLFNNGSANIVASSYGSTGSYMPLSLQTSDLDRLYITSGGNVGIGTTSPAAKLHISGNANSAFLYSDGAGSGYSFADIRNTGARLAFGVENSTGSTSFTGALAYSSWIGSLQSNTAFQIVAGNSLSTTFLANGNVGIGTTSPFTVTNQTSLTLDGVNASRLDMFSGGVRRAGFYADSGISNLGSVTAIPLTFSTNDTERMRITSGGDVAIGTATPLLTNSNRGSVTINGSLSSILTLGIAGSYSGYLYSDSTKLELSSATQPLTIVTNGSERMRITSGGNVGIGTSSPGGKLHVVGEGIFDDGTNGRLTFANASSQNDIYSTTTSFGGWKNLRLSSNELILSSGGTTERMRITSGGNVGIGTTSPDAPLSFANALGEKIKFNAGAGNSYKINLLSPVNGGDAMMRVSVGDSFSGEFGVFNGGSYKLFVNNIGNVGIGTTSPSTKLDVVGAITASGGFFNSDMRLKDLTDYDYNVSDIKPITYLWKDGRDNKKHVGYSAQEVQKVMPDAVNEGTDGMLSVNYVEILVAKISQMEKEIAYLKSKI